MRVLRVREFSTFAHFHSLPFPHSNSHSHSRTQIIHCSFPFPWDSHGKNGKREFPLPMNTSTLHLMAFVRHTLKVYLLTYLHKEKSKIYFLYNTYRYRWHPKRKRDKLIKLTYFYLVTFSLFFSFWSRAVDKLLLVGFWAHVRYFDRLIWLIDKDKWL